MSLLLKIISGTVAVVILTAFSLSLLGSVVDFSSTNIPVLRALNNKDTPTFLWIFAGAILAAFNPEYYKKAKEIIELTLSIIRKK